MPTTYAIPNGRTVFDATLYTATGATQTVTNQYGFKPDLVWTKIRNGADNHLLADSVRGVAYIVRSNTTGAETNSPTYYASFNSNGFSLGSGNLGAGSTVVGWQWQAGQGTNTTNTVGSITSTVSVNQTAGFSIVKYVGSGTTSTVGHGLGVAPAFIAIKDTSSGSYNWICYHQGIGATGYNHLNLDAEAQYSSSGGWNNTAPSATVFTLGSGNANANINGNNNIAYCWAEVAGFSKFGSYTGNGSTNGPFIYLGFRPAYVMIKRIDTSAGRWDISDTSRNPYNYVTQWLYANYDYAEDNAGELYDFLSNGFKLRNNGSGTNASGGSYIYMAWAENPFKYATAR